jgi:peptidoglycan/xylan/chitin deacetylase (PgdA/CDA1 family)
MTLLIQAPNDRLPERRYVFDVVFSEWLGFDYDLATHDAPVVSVRLAGDPTATTLRVPDLFLATPDEAWLTERSMPTPPFAVLRADPSTAGDRASNRPLPVLFGEPGTSTQGWHPAPDGVVLTVDVFGTVFFMLSRYEEVVRRARDWHGRFPATAAVAGAGGFVDRPIADDYVDLLWSIMRRLWPRLERRASVFQLRLTHDVDQPWAVAGQPAGRVAKSLAADLFRRHDPSLAARRVRAVLDVPAGRVDHDPFGRFESFMDISERHGLRSAFYFQAGGRPQDVDFRYVATDPRIIALLRRIHERGHEVGLHTSYVSHLSPDRTRSELDALIAACDEAGFTESAWGVRQHFLRFETPLTWRIQNEAGLAYDSSLGFADDFGFRAGTCRAFPVYDLLDRRSLALRERPLQVMDTTFVEYLHLDLDAAAGRIRAIVDQCRAHRGQAVLLYHNNTLPGARFERHYRELIEGLLA